MQILYTDKSEDFVCKVKAENGSLKDARARIVLESNGTNLVFEGVVEDGNAVIPIKNLGNVLKEGAKGRMKLEVIVEKTLFQPWQSDFVVEEYNKVFVEVEERKTHRAVEELFGLFKSQVPEHKTPRAKQSILKKIVEKYSAKKPELMKEREQVLRELSRKVGFDCVNA